MARRGQGRDCTRGKFQALAVPLAIPNAIRFDHAGAIHRRGSHARYRVFLVLEPCFGIGACTLGGDGLEPRDDANQGYEIPIATWYPLGPVGSGFDYQHAKVLG